LFDWKAKRKGKADDANLLFDWRVDQYRPSDKKMKKKDRGSQDANGLLPLLGNQLAKTKKKETEKQRGRLVVRLLLLE